MVQTLAISNGISFAQGGLLGWLKDLVGWPVRITYAAIQAFGNVFDFVFRFPAGSVLLTAQ
jgi:hypothetical protein